MNHLSSLAATAVAILTLASCSHSNEWKVEGTIAGADQKEVILEASANGRWYPIDTLNLSSSGKFSGRHLAAGYPDIYRLRLPNSTGAIYFPIDSVETITVEANADNLESSYTIAGTEQAELFMNVENRLRQAGIRTGAAADSLLKRDLGQLVLADPSGIVAYYIINKSIAGYPIFDPQDRQDNKLIGAVANAYASQRPNDPRTRYLKNLFLTNRTMTGNTVVEAAAVGLFDIDLIDNKGKHQLLSDVANQNKVVLLSFTAYGADESPVYNVALNKLYEQYHQRGLEIYQVSIDADEYLWRETANNLPWVTVYNSPVDGNQYVSKYNVFAIPTLFIINNGEIAERITSTADLPAKLARYF